MAAPNRVLNLALAGAGVLASLLLLEGGARLLLDPPRYHDGPVEFHPALGFAGVPGHRHAGSDDLGSFTFELNSQGLRGREVPAEPGPAPPGMRRVIFVGDSFLVGQAVREEHLMTSLAAAELASRGVETELYNLSGIDYGTGQEILLLRRWGRRLEPDAVVLFLYTGNDLINNSMALAGRSRVSAGDYIRPYLVPEPGGLRVRYVHPLRAWIRRHSRLYATLERGLLALGAERQIEWLKPWPPVASVGERLRVMRRAPREEFEIFRRNPDPGDPWEEAWRTSFALLRAFRDETDAMGARLLVVVIPSVHQVERTAKGIRLDIATRLASGASMDRILDWNLPERRFAAFFEEEGIEARFLLGALREATASGDSVYARDEHLSRRGHEIAAGSVVEWLLGGSGAGGSVEFTGEPVFRLPEPTGEPHLLDFRRARHQDYLGDGWLVWGAEEKGRAGGWLCGPRALVVLPAGGDELVVRGRVPPEARRPVEGRVEITGVAGRDFRLVDPGPFEIRVSWQKRAEVREAMSRGYLAVLVAPGMTHRRGRVRAGLLVQQVGFVSAAGAGDDE